MKSLSDQELMRIVQSGDLSPAGELYDRYSSQLFSFVYRLVGDWEMAKDVTQETFMRMMQRANQFNRSGSLKTWIYSIAHNYCRDHFRKLDTRVRKVSDEVLLTMPASNSMTADDAHGQRISAVDLERLLARLDSEQVEVILLAKHHGFTYGEMAKIFGCSEGAMKTRVFRAMEALKNAAMREQDRGGNQCLTAG
jgi:RNA polymerase sigma factor (sigma-70 family)